MADEKDILEADEFLQYIQEKVDFELFDIINELLEKNVYFEVYMKYKQKYLAKTNSLYDRIHFYDYLRKKLKVASTHRVKHVQTIDDQILQQMKEYEIEQAKSFIRYIRTIDDLEFLSTLNQLMDEGEYFYTFMTLRKQYIIQHNFKLSNEEDFFKFCIKAIKNPKLILSEEDLKLLKHRLRSPPRERKSGVSSRKRKSSPFRLNLESIREEE